MSRRTALRTVGAGTVVGTIGCLGNGSTGDLEGLRIGVLSPVSGSFEPLGRSQRQGSELAVDGLEGDEDLPEVHAVYADTEGSPSVARARAIELIEDEGVDFLVGSISSDVAPALNHLAADREVLFAPGASSDVITGRECNEYVFRVETSVNQIAGACAPWAVENLGSSVWFHLMDYAYGESIINEWRPRMYAADGDLDLAGVSRSPPPAEEYGEYVDRILESDADVLVLGMIAGALNGFLSELADRDLEGLSVISTTASFRITRAALGDDAAGVYSGVRYDPTLETGDNEAFVEAYESAYGEAPDNFSRAGYDSIRMFAEGVREAGTTDADAVVDALEGHEFTSVLGSTRIRECDHQAMIPTWIGRLEATSGPAGVDFQQHVDPADAIPPCQEVDCQL